MAIQMTRAEYEAMYGIKPSALPTSKLDTSPAPLRMTRAEYEAVYGEKQQAEPGLGTRLADRTKKFGQDMLSDNRGLGGKILRTGGFVAGAVADVATAAIAPVINKTADVISESSAVQKLATTDTVGAGLDAVDAAGQRFGRGMDKLETDNPVLAQDVRDLGNIASVLPFGKPALKAKEAAGNARVALDQSRSATITANIERELFDIENNYAKTRTANEYSTDAGAASRNRIAQTDVLANAVDETGTIRTKLPGGAVEQYRKQTIGGVENVVRRNLIETAEKVSLDDIKVYLTREIGTSGLEGADLVTAMKGIERELEGLKLRSTGDDLIDLYKVHDAKVGTTGNINYLTPPETARYRKAVARAYRKVVEEKSTKFDVIPVNRELSKFYEDIKRLETLDGKKVRGGKLGKYFAQLSGNMIGGAAGAVGGAPGAAIGAMIGGEAAGYLKGRAMANTFGSKRGAVAPKSAVLENARLSIPDEPLPIPKEISSDPKVARLSKDIEKNVEAQKKAIETAKKTGDFSPVQALKDIYTVLVAELKKLIEAIKTEQGGYARFFDDQSYNLGKRKTQYANTANQNNPSSIPSKVSQTDPNIIEAVDNAPDLRELYRVAEAESYLLSVKKINNTTDEIFDATIDNAKGMNSKSRLPILVQKQADGTYDILDGKHRFAELQLREVKDVWVIDDEALYRKLAEKEEQLASGNIRQSTDGAPTAKTGEWTGTPSSKQSTAGDMSISKKPIDTAAGSKPSTAMSGGGKGDILYHGTSKYVTEAVKKAGKFTNTTSGVDFDAPVYFSSSEKAASGYTKKASGQGEVLSFDARNAKIASVEEAKKILGRDPNDYFELPVGNDSVAVKKLKAAGFDGTQYASRDGVTESVVWNKDKLNLKERGDVSVQKTDTSGGFGGEVPSDAISVGMKFLENNGDMVEIVGKTMTPKGEMYLVQSPRQPQGSFELMVENDIRNVLKNQSKIQDELASARQRDVDIQRLKTEAETAVAKRDEDIRIKEERLLPFLTETEKMDALNYSKQLRSLVRYNGNVMRSHELLELYIRENPSATFKTLKKPTRNGSYKEVVALIKDDGTILTSFDNKAETAYAKYLMDNPSPLTAEAKKYKSAEEFVKAQGTKFVHETDASNLTEFDITKAGANTGDSWLGRGIYFQQEGTFKIEKYGKNKVEAYISPTAKIFEVKETPGGKWRDSFIEALAKKDPEGMTKWVNEDKYGDFKAPMARDFLMNKSPEFIKEKIGDYDGLVQDGELVIYNPKVIKTKSQLEAIWKQSQP